MKLTKSQIKQIVYVLISFFGSFVLIAHGIILDFDLNSFNRITWQGIILSTITIYLIMNIYEKVHEYDDYKSLDNHKK